MSDELAARRAAQQKPEPTMAETLADTLDLNDRLAAELKRLGEGIGRLRDEWASDDHLRPAADRLNALLNKRPR